MAAGRYVLLAEDNQVNQEVGRAMLESLGCRVDVAGNGREALSLLESTSYDLILMDCQMPLMNGWEATMEIRKNGNPNKAGVPVVALTAHIKDGDREQCLAAGMDDYLSKPFRLRELSDIVERWAGRGSTFDGGAGNPDTKESPGTSAAAPDTPTDQMDITGCIDCGVLENLKSIFGAGGRDMLAGVIRIYISDSPALLDRMSKALQNRDSEDMFEAAHALKSSSANLGAIGLAGLCRTLEDIARMGATEGNESIIVQIQAEYERVRAALEKEHERGV